MITHVKHLQEALERFNPEASLSHTLDVQGVSPATECVITVDGFKGEQELNDLKGEVVEMEREIDKLEARLIEIRNECEKAKPEMKVIKSLSDI